MNGLIFNGVNSKDLGLVMLSKNRPFLPEPKIITDDVSSMNGDYDFSSCNPFSRTLYKPITLEVEFAFAEKIMSNVRTKARQIAAWLSCGEQKLIFEDEPTKYYIGRVINKLEFENTISQVRRFTVQFKCKPFAYELVSVENIILDSSILLDCNLRLNDEYCFSITENTTIEVNNFGTQDIQPLIEISGSFTTLSIAINGKVFNYTEAINNKTIKLDCALLQVKEDTVNKNNSMLGDFLVLIAGINSVQISGTDLNCTVTFKFNSLYF